MLVNPAEELRFERRASRQDLLERGERVVGFRRVVLGENVEVLCGLRASERQREIQEAKEERTVPKMVMPRSLAMSQRSAGSWSGEPSKRTSVAEVERPDTRKLYIICAAESVVSISFPKRSEQREAKLTQPGVV